MGLGGVHFKSKALAAQVVLLVVPLLFLSTVGFLSLKQDKALALHEATLRAQGVADDLLSAFRVALTPPDRPSEAWPCTFSLSDSGQIVSPPPLIELIPAQKPDESALHSPQRELWSLAQRLEIQADPTNAIEAWNRFLAENPPEPFAAIASFSLGVALENGNQSSQSLQVFKLVAAKYPNSVGESGLPLQSIALFKSVDWTAPNPTPELLSNVDAFGSNVVAHPSFLGTTLLTEALQKAASTAVRARIQHWLEQWQKDEASREVAEISVKRSSTSSWFWVGANQSGPDNTRSLPATNLSFADFIWLVVPSGIDTNWPPGSNAFKATLPLLETKTLGSETQNSGPHRFFCQTQSEVEHRLFDIVQSTGRVPDYMGVSVNIAGTTLNGPYPGLLLWHEVGYFSRRGGGTRKAYSTNASTKVLASAVLDGDRGAGLLNVSILLTSQETLYRNQRSRTFWLAAIIGIASLGAVIGLVVVWRGYSRQVQLNELKSDFVSSVSHELRAPIASVRLMAESLESGKLSEPGKKQEYYKFIGQECRRLSALIENVLDFARIEQGRKQYEMEPTDVASLMRQTVALMQPSAAERQVSLDVSMDDRAWECIHPVIDGRAIQQALVNLIDNAIKHSRAGSQVRVGLQCIGSKNDPAPDSSQWVEIWVEDNGPGIPQDQHEKIFERFYRLGSELRRETPGVGIGLSIVRHIVNAHGGKIQLRSSPGQGSRFSIQLPMASDSTHDLSKL